MPRSMLAENTHENLGIAKEFLRQVKFSSGVTYMPLRVFNC